MFSCVQGVLRNNCVGAVADDFFMLGKRFREFNWARLISSSVFVLCAFDWSGRTVLDHLLSDVAIFLLGFVFAFHSWGCDSCERAPAWLHAGAIAAAHEIPPAAPTHN